MASEELIAHLEMIQGVINRLAANSFSMKGLALTAVAGLAAVAFSTKIPIILGFGAVTAAAFGLLDGYYLYLERRYRDFFNMVRRGTLHENEGPFSLNYTLCCKPKDLVPGMFSWPSVLLYLFLALGSLALMFICPTS